GENGAGKSTLIKILSGVYQPDAGTISIQGNDPCIRNPIDAQRAGVAVIYQEFNLAPSLSARENIFLGREKTKSGFFSRSEEYREALDLFSRMKVSIDPETLCRDLAVAQQQIVEIAKALHARGKILVMDEPSATLTSQEVRQLFAIIRDLKSRGIGVIYISHRLEEVFEIADRVMVMRDGRHIGTKPVKDLTRELLIEMMVGRKIENEFPKAPAAIGAERLIVKNFSREGAVKNISFSIHSGEILGIAGLVGAGRTELARLVFGADERDSGEIFLDGKRVEIHSPLDAIRQGICLLTEDRKAQGLILGLGARENFALPNLSHWARFMFINHKNEKKAFARFVNNLKIKVAHEDQIVQTLSGGNQQKIVLAKWLEANSRVIIFDEPTRGIDVGAKYEIYQIMNELASQGKAILMISSELPEILGMCDRILVMHEGALSGEIANISQTSQEEILSLAMGKPA
ncbi:sugar ABC transporter ATP-binding protein, partial [Candidatus Sumerlaeota bacterium]|nr:sugar ABC transporter ATP-binding protein [Candidatus Sumerlaeota bacterium]